MILTSFLFALFHQPTDLAHWVSFTVTGVAYGWIRVASRSTSAAALMHATYNLTILLPACFELETYLEPGIVTNVTL